MSIQYKMNSYCKIINKSTNTLVTKLILILSVLVLSNIFCTPAYSSNGTGVIRQPLGPGYETINCSDNERDLIHEAFGILLDVVTRDTGGFQSCIETAPLVEYSGSRKQASLDISTYLRLQVITKNECYDAPSSNINAQAPVSISGESMKIDRNFLASQTAARIASVMAHEIMHNRGFRHVVHNLGSTYYSNTIPEQVEACVLNGTPNAAAGGLANSSGVFSPLGTFRVRSINHSRGTTGKYFNFEIRDVDRILGSVNWHNKKLIIRNNRTGQTSMAVLWRSRNGGTHSAHGRWDKSVGLFERQWEIGDRITILGFGTIQVLSNNHAGGSVGKYFNFEIIEADGVLGDTNWHDSNHLALHTESGGQIGFVTIWRSRNGGSHRAHGRWKDGAASGQWRVNDNLMILW